MRANSILQPTEHECWVTGSQTDLDLHHIYHGPRRKAADEWGCWVWLRHDVHMTLHSCATDLDNGLKRLCQERFEKLYGHDKFMEVFGKSYL